MRSSSADGSIAPARSSAAPATRLASSSPRTVHGSRSSKGTAAISFVRAVSNHEGTWLVSNEGANGRGGVSVQLNIYHAQGGDGCGGPAFSASPTKLDCSTSAAGAHVYVAIPASGWPGLTEAGSALVATCAYNGKITAPRELRFLPVTAATSAIATRRQALPAPSSTARRLPTPPARMGRPSEPSRA